MGKGRNRVDQTLRISWALSTRGEDDVSLEGDTCVRKREGQGHFPSVLSARDV